MDDKPSEAFLAGLAQSGQVRVTTVSTLTALAHMLLINEERFRRELTVPMLVWESPPRPVSDDVLLGTLSSMDLTTPPRQGEPQVFWLRKSGNKQNAFAMGVTFGRTENNDLCIGDHSVSRFHGYFQQERSGHWNIVDAESKNGTWLGTQKLLANQPTLLPDGARLRIGDVDLVFYEPASFMAYLHRRMSL